MTDSRPVLNSSDGSAQHPDMPTDSAAEIDLDAARIAKRKLAEQKADKIAEDAAQSVIPLPSAVSGAWLTAQHFDPVKWAVPRVLPEGLTVISGPPKAGKSFLVLAWALAMAIGRDASRFGAQPARPVLYLALEDGYRRLQSRCADLGFGTARGTVVPGILYFVTDAEPVQIRMITEKFLNDNPPGVVVIDTLAKLRTAKRREESTYDYDYRMLSVYHSIAKHHLGSAVLVVHHTRKEVSADFLDSVNGTYGVGGSVDAVLVLNRKRHEDTGKLSVTGRDVEENEYLMTGFPFWRLEGGSPDAAILAAEREAQRGRVGDRSRQVLDHAEAHGQITTAEAAAMLGVSSDQASAYLGRQVQAGRLSRSGRGVYVSLSTVGSVGSIGSTSADPTDPTHPTVDTRGYVWTGDDGLIHHDLAALWELADKRVTGRLTA